MSHNTIQKIKKYLKEIMPQDISGLFHTTSMILVVNHY